MASGVALPSIGVQAAGWWRSAALGEDVHYFSYSDIYAAFLHDTSLILHCGAQGGLSKSRGGVHGL
jgi:hypothetical protein